MNVFHVYLFCIYYVFVVYHLLHLSVVQIFSSRDSRQVIRFCCGLNTNSKMYSHILVLLC